MSDEVYKLKEAYEQLNPSAAQRQRMLAAILETGGRVASAKTGGRVDEQSTEAGGCVASAKTGGRVDALRHPAIPRSKKAEFLRLALPIAACFLTVVLVGVFALPNITGGSKFIETSASNSQAAPTASAPNTSSADTAESGDEAYMLAQEPPSDNFEEVPGALTASPAATTAGVDTPTSAETPASASTDTVTAETPASASTDTVTAETPAAPQDTFAVSPDAPATASPAAPAVPSLPLFAQPDTSLTDEISASAPLTLNAPSFGAAQLPAELPKQLLPAFAQMILLPFVVGLVGVSLVVLHIFRAKK